MDGWMDRWRGECKLRYGHNDQLGNVVITPKPSNQNQSEISFRYGFGISNFGIGNGILDIRAIGNGEFGWDVGMKMAWRMSQPLAKQIIITHNHHHYNHCSCQAAAQLIFFFVVVSTLFVEPLGLRPQVPHFKLWLQCFQRPKHTSLSNENERKTSVVFSNDFQYHLAFSVSNWKLSQIKIFSLDTLKPTFGLLLLYFFLFLFFWLKAISCFSWFC